MIIKIGGCQYICNALLILTNYVKEDNIIKIFF